jgi:hypothetical protein
VRGEDLVELVTLARDGIRAGTEDPQARDPTGVISTGYPRLDNLTIGYLMHALDADEAASA